MKKEPRPVRDITRLNSKIADDSRKRHRRFLSLTGQSTLEYAMIIAVAVAALAAMSTYVQRSVQANLKTIEDQINAQPTE